MKRKQKILLLGGEGFVGQNLAEYFRDQFDTYSLGPRRSVFKLHNSTFIQKDPYRAPFQGFFDVVIHLVNRQEKIPDLSKLELKLIENLRSVSFNHFIYFSSVAVYAKPKSEYAQRKLMLEQLYTKTYGKKHKTTILRLSNTFGPYQLPYRRGSLVANLFMDFLSNKHTPIQDLKARRDFIFSRDVAILVEKVIERGFVGTDDIASNKLTSIQDLITLIEKNVIESKLLIEDKHLVEEIFIQPGRSMLADEVTLSPPSLSLRETFEFYSKNYGIIKKIYE